jgi:nicastrin
VTIKEASSSNPGIPPSSLMSFLCVNTTPLFVPTPTNIAAAAAPLLCYQVAVQEASSSNPGIPPSSLMSFLRVNTSLQGLVLAEFDRALSNPYYASRFDNGSRVSADSIAATAAVLAAAVHRLAGGDPQQLQVRELVLRNPTVDCIARRNGRCIAASR